ncbi:glutamate-5-semialdehyde dehydrogenase [Howardella ureilytica]|nr:glutamate-5-semialdehyde dehydrogenase [Lachnospiraceae bacterium]MDY2956481.1 glutamate-5-semialdehyde dehydrogenase [Lachnospiraceae bacterium]
MISVAELGEKAKKVSRKLAKMKSSEKNRALHIVADALIQSANNILAANMLDVENAVNNGMSKAMLDRLTLTPERIEGLADGVRQVASLNDPIGEVTHMWERPNGIKIGKMRVPIGVVGMIYESRPNVTSDAFAICFKSGNACILRGGSDCIHSNTAIAEAIKTALSKHGFDDDALQFISDTDRKYVTEMLNLTDYIDLIIPRGSGRLINFVVKNATVPVIETGTGNCHIFVDESADTDMAVNIIENAKTQRIGVCNAAESLVVHKNIAKKLIPALADRLAPYNVEMRGDEIAKSIDERVVSASEDDWGKEYLDYIISIKVVDDLDSAIEHINTYTTGHSECIVTNNYSDSQRFLNEIDAACVYVNASTRFSDGMEFGFGAEIGISTQKMHARGPMGLEQITSYKYIIYGNGQIRK